MYGFKSYAIRVFQIVPGHTHSFAYGHGYSLYYLVPFIENSRKCALICSGGQLISGCVRVGKKQGCITKEYEEPLGGDVNLHYCDCHDGFMGLYP